MKILVTGANGQLGSALQTRFMNERVHALNHDQLDITDINAIRNILVTTPVDLVINAAAYNDVDRAEQEIEKAFLVNKTGPENLAIATREKKIPLVHVSTDYVFDGTKGKPYVEDDQVNPLSVYGKSKWAGEEAVRKNNPQHFIVRTAWLFHSKGNNFFTKLVELSKNTSEYSSPRHASWPGPRFSTGAECLDPGQKTCRDDVGNIIRPDSNWKELAIVNDQYSSPTYAPHLAEAIARLVISDAYGTYHMAGQGVASRWEQFRYFLDLINLPISIKSASAKDFKQVASRPMFSALTTKMPNNVLLPPWQEGVRAYVKECGVLNRV